MPSGILPWLRWLFQKFGLDVRRYTPDDFVDMRRQRLVAENRINLVLDVGANTGAYPSKLRSMGYGGKVISFEPLPEPFESLRSRAEQDKHWTAMQRAIGDRNGEIEINIAGNSVSSSVLPMLESHVAAAPESAVVGKARVGLQTLDSLYSGFETPEDRILLKLDVQGYEEQALAGAARVLSRTALLEIELSLVPLYEGQATCRRIIDILDDMGFAPVSVERGLTDPNLGHMLQIDAIFVRRSQR